MTRRALVVLAALHAHGTLAAPVARASDPTRFITEILTPAGWELAHRCDADSDVVSSRELRTPVDWSTPNWSEAPHWARLTCSELLVPAEWAGAFLGL